MHVQSLMPRSTSIAGLPTLAAAMPLAPSLPSESHPPPPNPPPTPPLPPPNHAPRRTVAPAHAPHPPIDPPTHPPLDSWPATSTPFWPCCTVSKAGSTIITRSSQSCSYASILWAYVCGVCGGGARGWWQRTWEACGRAARAGRRPAQLARARSGPLAAPQRHRGWVWQSACLPASAPPCPHPHPCPAATHPHRLPAPRPAPDCPHPQAAVLHVCLC